MAKNAFFAKETFTMKGNYHRDGWSSKKESKQACTRLQMRWSYTLHLSDTILLVSFLLELQPIHILKEMIFRLFPILL